MIPAETVLEETRRTLALLRPGEAPLLAWVRKSVLEPLRRFLEALFEAAAELAGTAGGNVLLAAVILLAAALLAWLAVHFFRRGQAGHRLRSSERVARLTAGPVDPAASDAEAERLAAAGRFVEAVRLLYLAAFVRLHRRSGRPFDPSLTPGENLLPFRREPWFARLRGFVRLYQAASFGGAALDEPGYREIYASRPPEAAA